MGNWERLYQHQGIIQKAPSEFALAAVNYFKRQKLKNILDLGCGTGRHLACLLSRGFTAWGCDSAPKALHLARKRLPQVPLVVCDMTRLPYRDGLFDGILCHQVIMHNRMSGIEKTVSEMRRVLNIRGIVYLMALSTEHPTFTSGEEIEPNTKINTDALDGAIPHHFFTEKELRDLFRTFEILKVDRVSGASELDPDKGLAAFTLYARKKG